MRSLVTFFRPVYSRSQYCCNIGARGKANSDRSDTQMPFGQCPQTSILLLQLPRLRLRTRKGLREQRLNQLIQKNRLKPGLHQTKSKPGNGLKPATLQEHFVSLTWRLGLELRLEAQSQSWEAPKPYLVSRFSRTWVFFLSKG